MDAILLKLLLNSIHITVEPAETGCQGRKVLATPIPHLCRFPVCGGSFVWD